MATKPDLSDTLTALKMHLGKIEPDLKYDVDGNGIVDLVDALGLQKAYLGKDPGFVFADNAYFQSPSTKTAADYAAEKKANEDRVAAEKAEADRRQKLLEDANKYTAKNVAGAVTAEEVRANPNMTAEQLANKHVMDYWGSQSEAYSRVMDAMNKGTAKFIETEDGLAITAGGHPGYDTLQLRATSQPGVYQFSTYNQVAGGNIHGLIAGDPKAGTYMPVANAATMTQYTPGSPGGWARGVVGDLGDALKSMGPIPILVGNAILPGAGSALGAALALDEGNTTGALLSGLSAAGAMGADAAKNALAAEVSGNADLANQYSSGVQGTLAANLPEVKTATSAAQLANAVDTGNVAGALNAAGNLAGTAVPSELKTGVAVAGLAQALNNGDTAQALALAGNLTDNPDAKLAAQAARIVSALDNGNLNAAISAGTALVNSAEPYLKDTAAASLTDQTIDPEQFDAAELDFGSPATQLTEQELADIVSGGIGDATLGGGDATDQIADDGTTEGVQEVIDSNQVADDGTTDGIQDVIEPPPAPADDGTTDGIQDVIDELPDTEPEPQCAEGFHWDGSMCVADDDTPDTTTTCPDGYVFDLGAQACVPIGGELPTTPTKPTTPSVPVTPTKPTTPTPPVQQPTVPATQQQDATGLLGLLALMGGGAQQAAPTQPAVADMSGMVDIEELLANPLQTDYRKHATKPKMAAGGSIDDLLALLNEKG